MHIPVLQFDKTALYHVTTVTGETLNDNAAFLYIQKTFAEYLQRLQSSQSATIDSIWDAFGQSIKNAFGKDGLTGGVWTAAKLEKEIHQGVIFPQITQVYLTDEQYQKIFDRPFSAEKILQHHVPYSYKVRYNAFEYPHEQGGSFTAPVIQILLHESVFESLKFAHQWMYWWEQHDKKPEIMRSIRNARETLLQNPQASDWQVLDVLYSFQQRFLAANEMAMQQIIAAFKTETQETLPFDLIKEDYSSAYTVEGLYRYHTPVGSLAAAEQALIKDEEGKAHCLLEHPMFYEKIADIILYSHSVRFHTIRDQYKFLEILEALLDKKNKKFAPFRQYLKVKSGLKEISLETLTLQDIREETADLLNNTVKHASDLYFAPLRQQNPLYYHDIAKHSVVCRVGGLERQACITGLIPAPIPFNPRDVRAALQVPLSVAEKELLATIQTKITTTKQQENSVKWGIVAGRRDTTKGIEAFFIARDAIATVYPELRFVGCFNDAKRQFSQINGARFQDPNYRDVETFVKKRCALPEAEPIPANSLLQEDATSYILSGMSYPALCNTMSAMDFVLVLAEDLDGFNLIAPEVLTAAAEKTCVPIIDKGTGFGEVMQRLEIKGKPNAIYIESAAINDWHDATQWMALQLQETDKSPVTEYIFNAFIEEYAALFDKASEEALTAEEQDRFVILVRHYAKAICAAQALAAYAQLTEEQRDAIAAQAKASYKKLDSDSTRAHVAGMVNITKFLQSKQKSGLWQIEEGGEA